MPKFTATINTLKLDGVKFTAAIIAHIQEQMKYAGREFAKTAIRRIPIRTGFLAGAFANLEELLGEQARLNPVITYIRSVRRGQAKAGNRFDQAEYYYQPGGGRIRKSPSAGRGFSTPPDKIFSIEGNKIFFRFNVDITYFRINDNFAGRSPTAPWGAFEAGREAFLEYMRNNALENFPKITDFLTRTLIRVG